MKKLFGGGGVGGGSKLGPPSTNTPNAPAPQQLNDRDYRGHTINVAGMSVIIESKLAEGGFSIVFLVKQCQSRQNSGRLYALKRQFVNEPALLESCKREIEITRTLGVRHPNIITYVASSLKPVSNSDGNVYEYLLLTEFYRGSVLRLMNERLAVGQWLNTEEVLRIFTDVCAAVARLHHCQTPVIHRDLKVENLLLDEDGRCVLCDFGSATTRTLSTKTHSRSLVEDEIARFTTLSYRAPEMIDLYAGHAITTKADIWALGVMLYKLCYFTLPFGESALGIHSATFTFPSEPSYFPLELLGLIVYMLAPDVDRRPDIFQVSSIAYRLRSCQCPVKNLNNVAVPDNTFLVKLYRDHGSQRYGGTYSNVSTVTEKPAKTSNSDSPPSQATPVSNTTSVAPRQRPKPRRGLSPATTPTLDPSLVPPTGAATTPISAAVPAHVVQRLIEQGLGTPPPVNADANATASAIGQTGLVEEAQSDSQQQQQEEYEAAGRVQPSVSQHLQQQQYQQHRRNASDPSAALLDSTHLSAFKPYKSQQNVPTETSTIANTSSTSWNPFDLDDHSFGISFDALPRPRKGSNASTVNVKSRESLIIDAPSSSTPADLDPFGAAPFRPRPQPPPKPANASALLMQQKKKMETAEETAVSSGVKISLSQAPAIVATSSLKMKKGYKKLIEDAGGAADPTSLRLPPSMPLSSRIRRRSGDGTTGAAASATVASADSDSVGSASDLQARMQASGSSTGEEDENHTIRSNREKPSGEGKRGGRRRGHRARRTTSSDDNDDEDDEQPSTDEADSAGEGTGEQYRQVTSHRSDPDEEELNNRIKQTAVTGAGSKSTTTAPATSNSYDDGGIEGSYLEQDLIGRQPLLADDDEEEPAGANQLTTMLSQTSKATGESTSTSITTPSNVESLELSVISSTGLNSSSTTAAGGDVFRRAPFLATHQQQPFHLGQRPHHTHSRSSGTAGATAAFVNTSFQGDEALRLE